jgi:hypothetical protein
LEHRAATLSFFLIEPKAPHDPGERVAGAGELELESALQTRLELGAPHAAHDLRPHPVHLIGAHLTNHALGLISLDAAERGMGIAVEVWYSVPGTLLLYGAAATHFLLALWAVYERRTFRLPPLELLRIALGFTLPIILIGHAANTRLAYELFGLSSDYTRVVANLGAADQQGLQSAPLDFRVDFRVPQPSTGWLQHPDQLTWAALEARRAFERAVQLAPDAAEWHLFYAGPAPLAVAIGQQLNPTMYPAIQLYEYRHKESPRYKPSIRLRA